MSPPPSRRLLDLDPDVLFPVIAQHVNREVALAYGDNGGIKGRCVPATAVTIEVLTRLGFTAVPLSVELQAADPNTTDWLEHGSAASDELRWASLGDLSKGPALDDEGWRGHLVTISRGRLIDPTVEQISDYGVVADRESLVMQYPPNFIEIGPKEYVLHRPDPKGVGYAYRPSPDNEHFRTFSAWTHASLRNTLADEVLAELWRDPRVTREALPTDVDVAEATVTGQFVIPVPDRLRVGATPVRPVLVTAPEVIEALEVRETTPPTHAHDAPPSPVPSHTPSNDRISTTGPTRPAGGMGL